MDLAGAIQAHMAQKGVEVLVSFQHHAETL